MYVLFQPDGETRLGDFLVAHLQDPTWDEFRAAVAFVKASGVRHLFSPMREFVTRGIAKLSVGVDFGGTSLEGLKGLLDCVGDRGEVWVYHNQATATFHPKVYLFTSSTGRADLVVGSGNLTEGGLFTNYEANLAVSLDRSREDDAALLTIVEQTLDSWCTPETGAALRVTTDLLDELLSRGYITRERTPPARRRTPPIPPTSADTPGDGPPLFASVPVPSAPTVATLPTAERAPAEEDPSPETADPSPPLHTGFVMTLQRTDVGVGQTTSGTSRRSPEIFIPLAARDYAPDFWGWPYDFTPDPRRAGKMDRFGVRMRLGTQIIDVNMMTWPVKHDFRLRNEALRSAGNVGDILRLEKTSPSLGIAYEAEVIPQATTQHAHYLSLCTHSVRNSTRRWGYY